MKSPHCGVEKQKCYLIHFTFHLMHCNEAHHWPVTPVAYDGLPSISPLITCTPIWYSVPGLRPEKHTFMLFSLHSHWIKHTLSEAQEPIIIDGCIAADWPTMVCMVLASWLMATFSSPPWPSGLEWVNLKWSTAIAGFFQSTWMESSVWPTTFIPSIPETSEEKSRSGQ